jgi:hypothetical protein
MKMEQTECSETLAFQLQTPGNNPKESLRQINCLTYFTIRNSSVLYETRNEQCCHVARNAV